MKKILIFLKDNVYGGIEREVAILANSLFASYKFTIVFLNKENESFPYKLNKKIDIKYLNNNCLFVGNSIKNLIKEIEPDTMVSTDKVFNKYILKYNNISKIYWDHSSIDNDFIDDKTINNFNHIIVPNKYTYNLFVSRYDGIENKVKIIPPYIENIKEINPNFNNKRLVVVSKLIKEKNLKRLVNMMKIVNKYDKEVILTIIGSGEEKVALYKEFVKNNLSSNIEFLGSLTNDEIVKEFEDCSLFLSISSSEAFPLYVLEAMSVGIPTICFKSQRNIEDIITNEINGIIVEKNNITTYAESILNIINDKELLQSLGKCAKELIINYTIDQIKGDIIKVLSS